MHHTGVVGLIAGNKPKLMAIAIEIGCSIMLSWDAYHIGAQPMKSNWKARLTNIMRFYQMFARENRKDNQ